MRMLILLTFVAALCGLALASTAGDGFVAVPDSEVADLRGGACQLSNGTFCGTLTFTEVCRVTPVVTFGLPVPWCSKNIGTVFCSSDGSPTCGVCYKAGGSCLFGM